MKNPFSVILILVAVLLLAAVVFVLIMGPQTLMARMMGDSTSPGNLDTAATRLSEQQKFKISYTSSDMPIPLNQIHNWTLHVETAAGQTVEQAEITVNGGMPQHGHGLPTQPMVTQNLGGGDYLVEGIKFQMPGWWIVSFSVNSGGQSDIVTFNLVLP